MLKDYAYTGEKGSYWIKFDETQDGRVKAGAAGPIVSPGGFIGDIASVVAETAEEADKLLMAKLEKMGA